MAGYIGSKASVVSSGAERKKTFTITGATTSLTGLNYTVGKVHVFQNGVRLVDGTDYTATNGTTITLTVAAQSGDNVVVISQADFQVSGAVSTSGDTMTGDLTVQGAFTSQGIDDNGNATALTIDSSEIVLIGETSDFIATTTTATGLALTQDGRFTLSRSAGTPMNVNKIGADGALIDFWKTGAHVGSIGVSGGNNTFISGSVANHSGLIFATNEILPTNTGGAGTNGLESLGSSSNRFKDLYLSGGVYLGGTGAANKLDDYESGTFNVRLTDGTNTSDIKLFAYVKTGDAVHIHGPLGGSSYFVVSAGGTGAGADLSFIGSLPYTPQDEGGIVSSSFRGMRCSDGTSIIGNGIMPVLGWRSGSTTMYLDHTKDENSYSYANNIERDSTRTNIVMNFNGWYRTSQ